MKSIRYVICGESTKGNDFEPKPDKIFIFEFMVNPKLCRSCEEDWKLDNRDILFLKIKKKLNPGASNSQIPTFKTGDEL